MAERVRSVTPGRVAALAAAAVLPLALAIPVAVQAGSSPAAGAALGRAPAPAPARTLPAGLSMWGWGTDNDGELGSGTRVPFTDTPVQVKLPSGVSVTATRAGCQDTVALTSKGTAYAWGNDTFGEVGDGGSATARTKPVAVKLPKGAKLTSIRSGCDHNLALTSTGTVLAWGLNKYGQLGDGTTKNRRTPVQVKLPKGTKVTAISTGCNHSLAVTSTGKLYAWGFNKYGQLGDGTTKNRHTPVQVKLPSGAKAGILAGGCDYSLANTSQGLFGWGQNDEGQFGNDTTTSSTTPVLIPLLFRGAGPGTITSLFAGCDHSMALFSKGGLLAWGNNNAGQLGNGTTASSDKPVVVSIPTGDKIRSIAEGCFNGLALTTTGTVLAWGANAAGELGTGSVAPSDVPIPVDLEPGLVPTAIGSGPAAQHGLAIVPGAG
jgi:alpha-tubulin suppressor-like RCC1 family protein